MLDQLSWRKTEMMSQIAASATDSVHAAAALQYVIPIQVSIYPKISWLVNIPLLASVAVSTQSKPAPALA